MAEVMAALGAASELAMAGATAWRVVVQRAGKMVAGLVLDEVVAALAAVR